jgi:S1-C subfamily serine protease
MKRTLCSFALTITTVLLMSAQTGAADDAAALNQSPNTVSLDLKFTRHNANPLQQAMAILDWGPNGYATGFLVGDGLVMTAYHVVSGNIDGSKKAQLGFSPEDKLDVKVNVNGCQATVLKVDADADLALLGICQSQKQARALAFQTSPSKDDRLILIARPHGDKQVGRGVLYGPYMFRGQQYWSAKIAARDGYSGSPVYNDKAELVGVFSGYDWSNKLAVISPAQRAQEMLKDYTSKPKP